MTLDPTRQTRLALLVETWPRLRDAIPIAAAAGADWFSLSTPLQRLEHDTVGAHAGIMPIPAVIDGTPRVVAGMHAVCTAISHRGRGLGRVVIEAAIEHAASVGETIVLHAADAAVYRRFGFREVQQWVWTTDTAGTRRTAPMRRLRIDRPADVAQVHASFRARVPVADSFAIGEANELFVLDEVLACGGFSRLWWAEDLGAVIACDLEDRVLQIYDVVAPHWPSLADIVARADGRVDRVEVFFAPDRWPAIAWGRRPADVVDVLMVRGPFTSQPIIVPPLARC